MCKFMFNAAQFLGSIRGESERVAVSRWIVEEESGADVADYRKWK